MANLRMRFIAGPGFVSAGIRFVTNSPWSHVELITDDDKYLGAQYPDGVAIRPTDYCIPVRERRYSVPVSDSGYIKIMNYARSKVGTPYNFMDIMGLLSHRRINSKGKYICSEFVIDAAQQGGLSLLNVLPEYDYLITPAMLHMSPVLIGRCYYQKG